MQDVADSVADSVLDRPKSEAFFLGKQPRHVFFWDKEAIPATLRNRRVFLHVSLFTGLLKHFLRNRTEDSDVSPWGVPGTSLQDLEAEETSPLKAPGTGTRRVAHGAGGTWHDRMEAVLAAAGGLACRWRSICKSSSRSMASMDPSMSPALGEEMLLFTLRVCEFGCMAHNETENTQNGLCQIRLLDPWILHLTHLYNKAARCTFHALCFV